MDFASAGYFSDGEIISDILKIHAIENPRILDVTYNSGKIWKSLDISLVKSDINPEYKVDVVSDFMEIPFRDRSFDVIVFDPRICPHTLILCFQMLDGLKDLDYLLHLVGVVMVTTLFLCFFLFC